MPRISKFCPSCAQRKKSHDAYAHTNQHNQHHQHHQHHASASDTQQDVENVSRFLLVGHYSRGMVFPPVRFSDGLINRFYVMLMLIMLVMMLRVVRMMMMVMTDEEKR